MEITSEEVLRHSAVVRARQTAVLDAWHHEVLRDVAGAERLSRAALVEPVAELVARLCDWIDDRADRAQALTAAVELHAGHRFRHGYPINSLIAEYARLRHCFVVELQDMSLILELDPVLDTAIATAAACYMRMREDVRERVIGVLAHDLRSPLACVTMAAEMLQAGDRSPRERSLVELVLDSADRMHRMINDVLDWARAHADRTVPLSTRSEDFAEILQQVIDETRVVHGKEAISCQISGDLRSELDRDRVHQVLTNLVRNAIEHGAGTAHVEVSEADGRDAVVLVVRNRGPLRSPNASLVATPFEPKRRTGRGLGLYIVDQIARAHGATLDIAGIEEDTAITIRWPKRRPTAL